jgi:hypothetical protein
MDIISQGLEISEIHWESKCRNEDLAHREIEIEWRNIDNERRAVNEKAEQLKVLLYIIYIYFLFTLMYLLCVSYLFTLS